MPNRFSIFHASMSVPDACPCAGDLQRSLNVVHAHNHFQPKFQHRPASATSIAQVRERPLQNMQVVHVQVAQLIELEYRRPTALVLPLPNRPISESSGIWHVSNSHSYTLTHKHAGVHSLVLIIDSLLSPCLIRLHHSHTPSIHHTAKHVSIGLGGLATDSITHARDPQTRTNTHISFNMKNVYMYTVTHTRLRCAHINDAYPYAARCDRVAD